MSVKEIGNKIASKTTWGRIQIKDMFGYDLIKANYSSSSLAKIAWDIESDVVGFGQGKQIVSILYTYFTNGHGSLWYKSYIFCLKTLWDENCLELEHNSTPEEFLFAKRLFNYMKAECKEGTIIGKNQISVALHTHALNLLDHI